jgi:hypothetical protein
MIGRSAGESRAHVPEQPGLEQLTGDRSTVDGHKRLIGPPSMAMDRTRYDVLTGAGVAEDQYRGITAGNQIDCLSHRPHCGAGARNLAGADLAFW